MVKNIIELLSQNDYNNVSHRVEIAKGKYEIAYNWKTAIKKIKRLWVTRKLK